MKKHSTQQDIFSLPLENTPQGSDGILNVLEFQTRKLEELKSSDQVLKKLNSINWDFMDDKTSYLTHNIHPYPAKFIPQIPTNLIAQLSLPGELVWDPFGGSGTTALEAILLGRRAVSTDANPIGEIIGEAKTATLIRDEEIEMLDWVNKLCLLNSDASNYRSRILANKDKLQELIPEIPNINKWFSEYTIWELAYLRKEINGLLSADQLALSKVAFSKTVLKMSFQDGETRYASKERKVDFGETTNTFISELKTCIKKSIELSSLVSFKKANFITANIMKMVIDEKGGAIKPNSVDFIVTSPPYPNATDYHLYHRFRIFWLGFDPRELGAVEIGSHLRYQKAKFSFQKYVEEMTIALQKMFIALRSGRYAALIIGDGVFQGKVYSSSKALAISAEEIGFEVVGKISRNIHKTKRSFIKSARRAREEDLLIIRKPSQKLRVTLFPASYKAWEYESKLREYETEALIGDKLISKENGKWLVPADSFNITNLKKSTFSHGYEAKDYSFEESWQAKIENGSAKRKRKESNYLTHGLHPYKGKFYPQLAKSLINMCSLREGDNVLDPFCGSGTLLLEGLLSGLNSFGCDLNPLAVRIAKSKTQIIEVSPIVRDRLFSQFILRLKYYDDKYKFDNWLDRYSDDEKDELVSWFPRKVLSKIAFIVGEIDSIPDVKVQEFLEVILSSLVRQISQQEPRDLRIRRRKEPIDDADVIGLFESLLNKQREKLLSFNRFENYSPVMFGKSSLWMGDSRKLSDFLDNGLHENSIDSVITSPPYATALPYIDTDRLSLLLLFNLGSKKRKEYENRLTGNREILTSERRAIDDIIEGNDFRGINSKTAKNIINQIYQTNKTADVGFRRKNQAALLHKYFYDMTSVISNLDKLVRKDGNVMIILGDNVTNTEGKAMSIQSVKATMEIGINMGWHLFDNIPISVTPENLNHAKNTICENSILWFKKK